MYTKILVPTDGSEFARKAELHALFLAKVSGAEIIALSVSENHFINGISLNEEVEQINEQKEEAENNENIEEGQHVEILAIEGNHVVVRTI